MIEQKKILGHREPYNGMGEAVGLLHLMPNQQRQEEKVRGKSKRKKNQPRDQDPKIKGQARNKDPGPRSRIKDSGNSTDIKRLRDIKRTQ